VIDDVEVSDGSARITFDAPSNGGSAITRYEYRLDGGSWTDTGSLSGVVLLDGLENSGTYSVQVRAVNGVGAGPASAPAAVRVRTTPAAPDVDAVVAGDGSLSIDFTPGDDGGDPIVGYEYSTDGGVTWRDADAGTTSPIVVDRASGSGAALANGTLYTVQLRAVNGVGSGAASVSTLVAPQGAPDAPRDVTLTPGDGRLVVQFAPGSDGGSAITRFEYRLDGGAWVDAGSLSSPITISGLTNGTPYQVEIRAVSSIGAGDASAPVSGTPSTVTSAPGDVVAVAGDAAMTISWSAPSETGGVPITSYVATLFDQPSGGVPLASCTTTSATTCGVELLDNGTTYYVGVVALNAAGTSPSSAPRVAATPLGRPSVGIASINAGANDLQVDVDVDDNGAPISTFEYRLDGGEWISAATSSEPFTISGLQTGTTYVVEVRARNQVGAGEASDPVSATPRTVPGAPRSLVATSADASVVLTWSAPSSDGGSAVTDYVVQYATSASGPFSTFVDGTSPPTTATVTGLTNGTAYVFRVAASNAAGTGTTSALASATPLAAPSAPNLTSLTVGSQFIQAAFTAPANNGGAAVTGYQYQLDGGEWRNAVGTTSPIMISGLTNGRSYTVALRAVNAVGGGVSSNTRTATPYGLPSAVPGFLASPASGAVQLSWDAANANGSPITAYNIIRWTARTEGGIAASYTTTATSLDVTGLGNGTYWFTIEATNAAGTGQRSAPRTSATVGGTVPAAPTIGDVVVEDGQVSLNWTAGNAGTSAITGYVLQHEDDGQRSTLINSTTVGTSARATLPSPTEPVTLRLALRSDAGIGAFSTVQPPVVDAATASDVGQGDAVVSSAVLANDRSTTVDVELAEDPADLGTGRATVVAASPASVDGTDLTEVTAALVDLDPGTTYHARFRAVSSDATTYGAATSFTTAAGLSTSGLDVTYDGEPVTLSTVTEPEGLDVARTFEGIDGTDYPSSSTPPTDAGTYRVTTVLVDDELSGSETAVLHIRPRALVATVRAVERDYDGTTDVELETELDGVLDGDEVALGSLPTILDGPGAGVDRIVQIEVPDEPLTGADAHNYSVELPTSTTVTIRRAIQRLEFTSSPPSTFRVGDTYTPSAESDKGLTITLSLASEIADDAADACVLDGRTVRAVAVGTCVLIATQEGSDDVQPAMTVAQFVRVTAAAPAPVDPAPTDPEPSNPSNPSNPSDPSDPSNPDGPTDRPGATPDGGDADGRRSGLGAGGATPSLGTERLTLDADDGTDAATSDGPGTDAAATAEGERSGRGDDRGSATEASGDDEQAVGLGDEVAGISESRGFFGSIAAAVTARPWLWLLLAAAVLGGGWWLLAARRRDEEDQPEGA
jgi:hypothetical protein